MDNVITKQELRETAETEKEATARLMARVPSGAYVLKEWSGGRRTGHITAVGSDEASASELAQKRLPASAVPLSKSVIRRTERTVRPFEGKYSEDPCDTIASKLSAELKQEGIPLSVEARMGQTTISTSSVGDTYGHVEVTVEHLPPPPEPRRLLGFLRRSPAQPGPAMYKATVESFSVVRFEYETPAYAGALIGTELDLLIYREDWERLAVIGKPAAAALTAALGERPHLTWELLKTLSKIDREIFEAAALRILKAGGSTAKDARKLLNSGLDRQNEYVTCPACDTYLGRRGELMEAGSQIDAATRQAAARRGTEIIGGKTSRCPKCGADVIVG